MIVEARRPVLYVGGGVIRARAHAELRQLAELTGIPVVTTLMARGAFPDSHPLHMGMPGMHGSYAANMAMTAARPEAIPSRARSKANGPMSPSSGTSSTSLGSEI